MIAVYFLKLQIQIKNTKVCKIYRKLDQLMIHELY